MLPKFFALFVIIGAAQLAAKAPIEVSKVDFDTTKDDWIQMQVELDFGDNTLPMRIRIFSPMSALKCI